MHRPVSLDETKRMEKHLGLNLEKAVRSDGSLIEKGIVIEDQEILYTFDDETAFPDHGIRHNDDVVW